MIDVVVLFFLFGLAAGLARSDLKLPAALYDSLSVFLLLAIGLKGGEGLAKQTLAPLAPQLGAVILLGVAQTLIAFAILRGMGRLGRADGRRPCLSSWTPYGHRPSRPRCRRCSSSGQ